MSDFVTMTKQILKCEKKSQTSIQNPEQFWWKMIQTPCICSGVTMGMTIVSLNNKGQSEQQFHRMVHIGLES